MNEIISRSRKGSLLPNWFHSDSDAFNTLQDEMDQLFNRMTRGFSREYGGVTVTPRADLKETDDSLVMSVDLPGFEEKDVDVALADNRLTVRAHTELKEEKKEGDYHLCERRVGNVSRMITLPCEVESDKVDAKLKDGVLTVSMPKSKASKAQTKHIKVKRAS